MKPFCRTVAVSSILMALAFFPSVLTSSFVQAQSSDVQALLDRINRLEADLNNVQRKVFQGQNVPAPSPGGSASSGGASGEAAALLSARIDALEQEQRQATGRMEEVAFKVDQLSSRLDKLVLDVDFRLSEIERRLNGGLAAGGTGGIGTASAPSQPSGAGVDTNSPVDSGLPKGTQLLGTLRVPAEGGSTVATTAPSAPAETTGTAVAATPPASAAPAEQYNYAISLIRKDDYAGAEQAFTQFLEGNKEHALAGNAQYWLGETHYVRGDYPNAASAFLNGYQTYPKNSKAADNLLKLAMTLGRMEQTEEACVTFQQLDKQFTALPARLKRIANRERQKFGCS
ncbi:MAG: tol-pal system protein YbgF [Sneathiella sp.]